jgi:hypothetical protein
MPIILCGIGINARIIAGTYVKSSMIASSADRLHDTKPHVRDKANAFDAKQQIPSQAKKPHRDVGMIISRNDVGISGGAGMSSIR